MNLKEMIEGYTPFNEQEEQDKKLFLKYITDFEDILTRENEFAHISSSSFVINKEKNKVIVVHHNLYDSWIYPGGHADGEENLLSVAVREVEEETGLIAKPIIEEIYGIQALPVGGHVKRGKYVSAHIHLDVIYLLEADDSIPLRIAESENSDIKWIPLSESSNDEIVDFTRPVNAKIVKKLELIR